MARVSPLLPAFNAGELSPLLDGRIDLEKYQRGFRLLENFLPTVQGPLVRRGGTRFVTQRKYQDRDSFIIPFEFSATQSFQLEFGDRFVRFFFNHGVVQVDSVDAWSSAVAYVPGDIVSLSGINYYCHTANTNNAPANDAFWHAMVDDIYEISSPYSVADLTNSYGSCALVAVQSGDVLYIVCQSRRKKVMTLTRFGNTRWVFDIYEPNSGPFLAENTSDTSITVTDITGNVTVAATSAVFVASDVGRLLRLDALNSDIRPWETGKSYVIGSRVRSDSKTYVALTNGTSGTYIPIHEFGNAWDGQSGVQWKYEDPGYGVLRITEFIDSQQVKADVIVDRNKGLNTIPFDVASHATTLWRLGAWSETTEYPGSIAFFASRLWLATKTRLSASVPGDLSNHSPDMFNEIVSDAAISEVIQDVTEILWMIGDDRLIVGTSSGEFVAGRVNQSDVLGPGNFQAQRNSKRRNRMVSPVTIGTTNMVVQLAGEKLFALDYSYDVDKIVGVDSTALANHITRTGIVQMAYQDEPYSILWCLLANGKLRGFTYEKEQDVVCWHRHPIGGNARIRSISTGSSPDGSRSELWMIAERVINGSTRAYIEFMESPMKNAEEDGTGGDLLRDAFYVDSGLTYSGPPVSVITGLSHLEGQFVQILADGAVQPDAKVIAGSVPLSIPAATVQIGLQATARAVTMRIEAGSQSGTAQGKIKRVYRLVVRMLTTLGGKFGMYRSRLDDISLRNPSTPMGQPELPKSGDVDFTMPGGYETDGMIEIRQEQPLPMTIGALIPMVRTYDG